MAELGRKMGLEGRKVLIFGVLHPDSYWSINQQLSHYLSAKNEVVYITWPRALWGYGMKPRPSHENVDGFGPEVFNPSVYRIPFDNTSLFLSRWTQKRILAAFQASREGFKPDVVISFHYRSSFFFDAYPLARKIYICPDEWGEMLGPLGSRQSVEEEESRILRNSHRVFTSSRVLAEKFSAASGSVELFDHGVDAERFYSARTYAKPPELASLTQPIVILAGSFDDRVDYELLWKVFENCEELEFVLLGRDASKGKLGKACKGWKHVHYLGEKSQAKLPAFYSHSQAAWIPYRMGKKTRSINPLKVREFLAMRLPVVSAPLPQISSFGESVIFFASAAEVVPALKRCCANVARPLKSLIPSWREVCREIDAKILLPDIFPKSGSMPNILHITVGLEIGGSENQLFLLLKELSGKPDRHHVLCLKRAGFFSPKIAALGVPLEHARLDSPFFLWRLIKLCMHMRRGEYSIIHSRLPLGNIFGALLSRVSGAPQIATYELPDTGMPLWQRLLERALKGRFKISTAVSASATRSVRNRLNRPVETIPNMLENRPRIEFAFPDMPNRAPRVFGSLARLEHRLKGQDLLIRAFLGLPKKARVQARLKIGGEGRSQSYLKSLVPLDFADRIEFMGPVSDSQGFYGSLDMLVIPSREEGFGLTLFEAILAGRPVLAADLDVFRELTEGLESVRFFRSGDSGDLGRRMEELSGIPLSGLYNAEDRMKILERFAVEKIAGKYQTLYRKSMEGV